MPTPHPESLDAERPRPPERPAENQALLADMVNAAPQNAKQSEIAFLSNLDINGDQETLAGDSGEAPGDTYPRLPAPLSNRQLHREVWSLAWPSVITMLLQTVNSLMDVFFVGHLPNGAHALAATGVGGSVMFLLISVAMGVSVGTTALVARFKGAEDMKSGIQALGQSLTLSFLLALVCGTLFYIGRGTLIGWVVDAGRSPEAALLGAQFLGAALLATVPLFLMNVLMGAFRGLGDTRTPMRITLATIATHITFNALLIYGHAGFPRMGVRGAGTAFAISLYVGVTLYLIALVRTSPLGEALQRKHLRFQPEWVIPISFIYTLAEGRRDRCVLL